MLSGSNMTMKYVYMCFYYFALLTCIRDICMHSCSFDALRKYYQSPYSDTLYSTYYVMSAIGSG